MVLAPGALETQIEIAERGGERDRSRHRSKRGAARLPRREGRARPCRPDGRPISPSARAARAAFARSAGAPRRRRFRRRAPAGSSDRKRASGALGMTLPPPASQSRYSTMTALSNRTSPFSRIRAGNLAERVLTRAANPRGRWCRREKSRSGGRGRAPMRRSAPCERMARRPPSEGSALMAPWGFGVREGFEAPQAPPPL